ncbi:MAG: replicative DNA helicase [Bacilli bacterium]|nr:replicative DNA helicase [Bacilli bacterium]
MIRNVPNSIEAEKAVLNAIFLSKNAQDLAFESIDENVFYYDNNKKIFNALKSLYDTNTPIDMTTITTELRKKGYLDEIGGVIYLTEVLTTESTAANINYYLKIVNDYSLLRRLIEVSNEVNQMGYDTDKDVSETLDESERKILSIVKDRRATEFKSIKEVVYNVQKNLQTLAETKGDITGIPTGWIDFDKMTSGLHENQLIIIGARPAMGKTAFALNLATNVAIGSRKSVAVFNLEMGAEQLANRMLSSLGQIEGYKFMSGKLNNNDYVKFNEALSQLEDTNLFIDDTPGITIGEIRSKCRRLKSSSSGLDLVIIDYLQLVSGGKNYGTNRQQEVSDISRSLKMLAMELEIPVIALCQLSRSVEAREDKRPLMSDLRESGSIEQDADIVAFLYRDDYYNKAARTDNNTSISEFIIGKHRNGSTGTINLLFKRDMSTFLNFTNEASVSVEGSE